MAETSNTSTSPSSAPTSPSSARKTTPRKSTGTRRTTTRSTPRSASAKSPSSTTARRTRTAAARETREAGTANARAAKVTAKQGRNVAERAALVYVGATLTVRDRALAFVEDVRKEVQDLRKVTTRAGAEQRIAGYERRGTQARTRLERDVRKARTRLERELTSRRRDAARVVRRAERTADRRPNVVAEQIAKVENAVQAGVAVGERLASTAKERVVARA